MSKGIMLSLGIAVFCLVSFAQAGWDPPAKVSREECVKFSQVMKSLPEIKVRQKEDIFRIHVVGMDWDLGVMVYEPEDVSKIPRGADGKKVGFFLLHGGSGDFRSMESHL